MAETEIEEMAETEDADPNHDAARDPAGSEEPTQSRSQESSLYTPSVDRDSPVRMDDRESPIWGSIDHNDGLVHVPNNSTDEKDERDKAKKKSKSRFSISFRRGKTKSKLQEVGQILRVDILIIMTINLSREFRPVFRYKYSEWRIINHRLVTWIPVFL